MGSARTAQKTSHVIPSQRVHWRADYCLATSYNIHIFHCCTLESIYRAIAWKRFEQIRYDIRVLYVAGMFSTAIVWLEYLHTGNVDVQYWKVT
jgi:hypothetical protein